ncbi:MAG: ATP-binding protein [Nanoarchaeota archaeon]|nr:ATP-binding protein [Nanoarchaeota archaeon]
MVYDIVLGRSRKDYEKMGTDASVLLGKHYVTMGKTTSLANNIYMDVNASHVVLITGKRGSGKSYTMGVMAEAVISLPDNVRNNIGMIFFDTMGLYWTTKYPNYKQAKVLEQWKLSPEGFDKSVLVYVPEGYFEYYKDRNIPVDKPFTIDPSDLSPSEWAMVFNLDLTNEVGVCIEKNLNDIRKSKEKYSLDDIIEQIKKDKANIDRVKAAAINRFEGAKSWGLFSTSATPLKDLVKRGIMSVVDISIYASAAGGFDIRSLVIGLVSRRLLEHRMVVRKIEELADVQASTTYFSKSKDVNYKEEAEKEVPIVWLFVDEAHEFLPPAPQRTLATDSLIQILREGRQPGVNIVLATQQPGKIHSDAITQSDIILSHRLTADLDINSLNTIMGAYAQESLFKMMNNLPRLNGSSLVMDDLGENVYPMQVRPRITWHGGGAPTVLPKDYETKEKPEEY